MNFQDDELSREFIRENVLILLIFWFEFYRDLLVAFYQVEYGVNFVEFPVCGFIHGVL